MSARTFMMGCTFAVSRTTGRIIGALVAGIAAMTAAPHLAFALDCAPFTFHDLQATVCRIDLTTERLRIFLNDTKDRPLKYFSGVNRLLRANDERLVFAMNAGMYHKDFSPVGLLVSDGIELRPLNLDQAPGNFFLKPNGVFLVSDAGARIVESSRYPALDERVQIATQSGPLLVLDGALHPAFREDSTSRYIRNGVGVLSRTEVVFAISETPVTFHEFATLFRNGLGCKDALFLDATVSSLYSEGMRRSDVRAALGPIIGVVAPGALEDER
jgi:uncharacterized protein YigE (DUF2233 family)